MFSDIQKMYSHAVFSQDVNEYNQNIANSLYIIGTHRSGCDGWHAVSLPTFFLYSLSPTLLPHSLSDIGQDNGGQKLGI